LQEKNLMITNSEISKVLSEIGEYLEMQDIPFKPRVYEKVSAAIDSLDEEAAQIYKNGGLKALESIPGVGKSIAEHIEELIKTGRLNYYEKLKKESPVDLSSLTKVEGLGPKKIKVLYQKLKIKNLKDLEKATKSQKIANLEGFGRKSEENILRGIEFVKKSSGRFLLGYATDDIKVIEKRLKELKEVESLDIAGSFRRKKETIGDIDLLAVSKNPKKVMDFFVKMPEVARVFARGITKSMVHLKNGIDVDLRVVNKESYGAALNYFTGSKAHNVALRKIAIKKKLKLNEYGLFLINSESALHKEASRGVWQGKIIAGRTEKEIYNALGMDYIEPEMREDAGEIELALKRKLPRLVGYGDLQGDLQIQTNWTDGVDSIEDMAEAAIRRGLKYIAITDHTKRLAMTGGLDEKRILKQIKEIDKLNQKFKNRNFKILKGTECDILRDGSLDLSDEILEKLDVVGISIHSHFKLSLEEQTRRVVRAMQNPHADILFHPTGRLIQKREPINLDIDEIIKIAKREKIVLEINAHPERLDLKDVHIRKCVEAGVRMSISSDAHSKKHFSFLKFGVSQARRGWAKRTDIINAWPMAKMMSFLKDAGKVKYEN